MSVGRSRSGQSRRPMTWWTARSVAVAPAFDCAERGPVDRQRAERAAEDEELVPPVGARPVRSSSNSSARTGLPTTSAPGQRRVGERHGAGHGEPGQQAVGGAGHGVLLVDDERHPPQDGAEPAGHAGVAADGDDGAGPVAADEADGHDERPDETDDGTDVVDASSRPGDAATGQQRLLEAGLGHEPGLEPRSDPTRCTSWPRSRSAVAMASAGSTWPAVPPPVTRTFIDVSRAALRGPAGARCGPAPGCSGLGPLDRHVHQHAGGQHRGEQRRPAEADERQRHAGDRQEPEHGADVDERLHREPRRDPDGQHGPEGVAGPGGDAQAAGDHGGEHGRRRRASRRGRAPRR